MNSKMNTKKTLLASMVGLFATAGGVGSALAQGDEAATAQGRIDEIVVTANKREQLLLDVPLSVTAMSGKQLKNAGIESLYDLSFAVPNLTVTEVSPGRQSVTIRGVGNARGTSSLIGLYIDEAAVAGAPEEQMDVRAIDLARVEVLRGPQGTLYGEGSTGGTIRYITNDPTLQQFGGGVDLSLYGTENGDFSEEITAVFDVPIVEDVVGLRIAGTYENKGGWVDQPAASRKNINDNDLAHIRIKGLWHATEALDLKSTVIIHRNDIGGSGYVNSGPNEDSNYISPVDPAAPSPAVDDYEFYNITGSYDLGSATLLSASSYAILDKSWVYGFFFGSVDFEGLSQFEHDIKMFTQEVRLTSNNEGPFEWTAGVFYRDYENREQSIGDALITGFFLPELLVINTVEDSKSWAIFTDISYALSERLKVGVGARHSDDKRDFSDLAGGSSEKGAFDSVDPRVNLAYAISENANVYVSAAKGSRSGGFNTAAAVALGASPTHAPEKLWSYEIGTKMSLLDGRLSADIALFQSDYTDMISSGLLGSIGTAQTTNIGKAKIEGIDWSFIWRPSDNLTLGFNGNVVDAQVTGLNATGTPQLIGDKLDTVADYGYSVTADYTFDWRGAIPGFFRVSYNEQGESFFTLRNGGLLPQEEVVHSGTLSFLNAKIGAEYQKWTLELYAHNLLDDADWVVPYGDVYGTANQARPRSMGIRIGREF